MDVLESIEREVDVQAHAWALERIQARFQAEADATPCLDADGTPLRKLKKVPMVVRCGHGTMKLDVWRGVSRRTGKYVVPFRSAHFRGERDTVSPRLEERLVATICETGAFEKASRLCAEWGVTASDDKLMDTIRRVGDACDEELLPKTCEDAAGSDDILVFMVDGWEARHRGAKWGVKSAQPDERVNWRDIKSAIFFKLSLLCDVSGKRRSIVRKHILATPAQTDPVDFGRAVEKEAMRMGLLKARKAYMVADGGVYIWNIFEDRFVSVAEGELDYYHLMQHLTALAEALYPDKADEETRRTWLRRYARNLKTYGPKTLLDAVSEIERSKHPEDQKEIIERECTYVRKHENHIDYPKARKEGVPIGSGAMESTCSQLQNRFKRRGQFWSGTGFGLFIRAYTWYQNGELKHVRRSA